MARYLIKNAFRLIAGLLLAGSASAATINAGSFSQSCPEDDCDTYRFPPKCRDSNGDGTCDALLGPYNWTQGASIGTVQSPCNAGDNATATPDVNPVHSSTNTPAGISQNNSTGVFSGTVSTSAAPGQYIIETTCNNDFNNPITYQIVANVALVPPPLTAQYYVDCTAGNDSWDGTHGAFISGTQGPWRTLSKVNNTVVDTSADVHIKDSSVCENQTLTVDWNGTDLDPVEINTYYMNAGTEVIGVQTARAEINGTYDATCSQSLGAAAPSTCLMSVTGAVPNNQFSPLIAVNANYVTLKDLFLTESAGTGINITNFTNLTIDNVKIDITASLAIFPRFTRYFTLRNSEVSRTGIGSSRGDNLYSDGPHAVSLQNSRPADALFENNYFHELYSEGINCRTSTHCIWRGNRFANVRTASIYFDNVSDSIAENNEIYGSTSEPVTPGSDGWAVETRGFYVAVEGSSAARLDSVRNVIRNNYIAGVSHCLVINVFPDVQAEGWQTGGLFVGNTCLSWGGNAFSISDPDANIAGWEIANNIFDLPETGDPLCNNSGNATTSKLNFHNNSWPSTPPSICQGSGDVHGASGVSLVFNWAGAGQGNFPTASDWELSPAGVADEAGVAMLDPIPVLSSSFAQFSSFSGLQRSGGSCNPSAANWDKELAVDADCVVRGSPPDIGAKED